MRIHEYLEIIEAPEKGRQIVCSKCGYQFCKVGENYKLYALYRENNLQLPRRWPSSGDRLLVVYQEYLCPGCGTLLEVDNYCPEIDGEEEKVLWDIQIG